MAQLTSKTIAAIDQLSIDDNTRTYTSSQSQHDEILHTTSHSVGHLTNSSCVGIIGQCHRDTQAFLEKVGQRYDSIVSPRKIGCKLYCSRIIVTIGSTDSHSFNFLYTAHLVDNYLQRLHGCIDIILYALISLGFDGCGSLDISSAVDNTKDRVRSS